MTEVWSKSAELGKEGLSLQHQSITLAGEPNICELSSECLMSSLEWKWEEEENEAKTKAEWTIYGFFLLPLMLDENSVAQRNTHVLLVPSSVPLQHLWIRFGVCM